MTGPDPKVLYIAGWGRSGSTILDHTLGQLDGFVSTGELRKLWATTLRPEFLCACGEAVAECPFWTRVRANMATIDGRQTAVEITEFQERSLRLRRVVALWKATRVRRPEAAPEPYAAYARTLTALYRALAEVTGARVVVDSSKLPADARLLATLTPMPAYVVHLVRDPRAVAYSWRGRALWTSAVHWRPRFGPLISSVRWATWNGMIEALVGRRLGVRYRRVRYEDFVADPQRAVAEILETLEEPRDVLPFTGTRTVRLEPNHMIQGNPRSRASTGETELRLDDEWRTKLGPWRTLSASMPALLLARRYGYDLLPRRSPRAAAEHEASVRGPAGP